MARDPSRKKARRPEAKPPKIDSDLLQIAQLLDEHRLETNEKGWFTLPWRDGENAVRLALAVYETQWPHIIGGAPVALWQIASDLQNTGIDQHLSYEQLDEYRYSMPISHPLSKYIRAALRCRQLKISNSHGGGHVYNDVLVLALYGDVTEAQVIEWRARDALNNTIGNTSQQWERARKTFELAWKRGLYHAAYAIKPVGD